MGLFLSFENGFGKKINFMELLPHHPAGA